MREVDQEDETKEDKYCRADEGDVVSPKDEETVWDEKGNNHQQKPNQDFRTPPAGKSERLSIEREE